MRDFWDRRAAENPLFFVDNKLSYQHPDADAFWAHGVEELDLFLASIDTTIGSDEHVLEIGCGVGRMTRVLAERAESVLALDVSPRMLELARHHCANLENVEWLLGDGESLAGVETASLDGCVTYVVFQHIPDPAITLGYVREVGRVLRPGGWAAINVSNDASIHRRRTGLEGLGIRLRALTGRGPRGQADAPWLGSAVSLADLRSAADDGGMDVQRISGEDRQLCFARLRRRP